MFWHSFWSATSKTQVSTCRLRVTVWFHEARDCPKGGKGKGNAGVFTGHGPRVFFEDEPFGN